jgi:peptide/nickel transport system permease protein
MMAQKKIFLVSIFVISYLAFADLIVPFDPIMSLDRQNLSSLPPLTRVYEINLKDGRKVIAFEYVKESEFVYYTQRFSRGRIKLEDLKNVRSLIFVFGTDNLGRDVLSRTIYGGKISLLIGIIASFIALFVGLIVGVFAGYFGGIADKILMRITDVFLAFPKLFLVLVVVSLSQRQTIFSLILILGLLSWMGIARFIRAEFLKLKNMEFVLALESVGFPELRIALKHILPNAVLPALVNIPLLVGDLILTESILSFIGFGVQPPTPTWGNMISEAEKSLLSTWWLPILPGILISATVLIMNWASEVEE